MRAAIYTRFSTEQSADSIDDQYCVCERHAERLKVGVVERFNDEAISGGTSQRPGYQAMLAEARRHLRGCGAGSQRVVLSYSAWLRA